MGNLLFLSCSVLNGGSEISVFYIGTWKDPKVIVKYVIGPFEGSKIVFNLC